MKKHILKIKTNQSPAMKQCVVFSQQQNRGKTAKLQWERYIYIKIKMYMLEYPMMIIKELKMVWILLGVNLRKLNEGGSYLN